MKHKYLQELYPKNELPFPFGEKGYAEFDERDTFNLDFTLAAWLYERLKYFQDEASKVIDFGHYRFDVDGEELTQIECINRMIEDCKIIILGDTFLEDDFKKMNKAKDDLFKILSKVYWTMWW